MPCINPKRLRICGLGYPPKLQTKSGAENQAIPIIAKHVMVPHLWVSMNGKGLGFRV